MTVDRRQSPDRRQQRPGGRRASDPNPSHGTRAMYRRGCDCLPCKAAEANYRAELRRDHARGKLRLGMHVSAKETWQRIRQLKPEFQTQTALASRLGYQTPDRRHVACLRLRRDTITVRNMLRVRLLHRESLLDGLDAVDLP